MAAAARARSANPLFADTPAKVWQLRRNEQRMAQEHKNLMNWVDTLLEQDGNMPFEYMDHNGNAKQILQTREEQGFFRVIMRSPPETGQDELQLIFSLQDLYLLGFLGGDDVWYMYKDARLEGTHLWEEAHESEWDFLPFGGSYVDDCFTSVKISVKGLTSTIQILLNHKSHKRDELIVALFRPIVTIPEAKRFAGWFAELQTIFRRGTPTVVGTGFQMVFKDWSKVCQEIVKGPLGFNPKGIFKTFYDAASKSFGVTVLLRRYKVKDDVAQDVELRNVPRKFLEDYDIEESEDELEEEEEEFVDCASDEDDEFLHWEDAEEDADADEEEED